MQNCVLHLDIFGHLLTLDSYYLPVKSFLALKATCKVLRKFYNMQRYINKYGKRNTNVNMSVSSDSMISIAEYYILPNKKYHGVFITHKFISRHYSDWSDNFKRRCEIAAEYGVASYLYGETTVVRYYLGEHAGMILYNQKLLGCEHIESITAKHDGLDLQWKYTGKHTRGQGCLEKGCSMTYNVLDYKKIYCIDRTTYKTYKIKHVPSGNDLA